MWRTHTYDIERWDQIETWVKAKPRKPKSLLQLAALAKAKPTWVR
ncbi:MAG TPA: hypothetical protein VFZ16_13180 [Hyphomicrobiaceae bacterium]|nr:hypothetical protein [Hyphomicrobiaceae bacterium]